MTLIHRGGGSSCRGRIFGAVALVLVLLATGCTASGGDGSPTGVAESSTTASPAPAPTTTAAVPAVYVPASAQGPAQNVPVPVLPEKAKEFSKEGLIAFAEYWYSTLSYVYETGDSGPMMAITDAGCKTCENVRNSVGSWYDKGGWTAGGLMSVVDASSPFTEGAGGAYQAVLMVQQSGVRYYTKDTTLNEEHPAGIARADIVVATFADGKWKALTAEHLSKD